MTLQTNTKPLFCLFIACFLLVIGCSKLTSENYEQLKPGMAYQEVAKILGKPDECRSTMGIKQCQWGDSNKYIKVNFAADMVVLFSSKGL